MKTFKTIEKKEMKNYQEIGEQEKTQRQLHKSSLTCALQALPLSLLRCHMHTCDIHQNTQNISTFECTI